MFTIYPSCGNLILVFIRNPSDRYVRVLPALQENWQQVPRASKAFRRGVLLQIGNTFQGSLCEALHRTMNSQPQKKCDTLGLSRASAPLVVPVVGVENL